MSPLALLSQDQPWHFIPGAAKSTEVQTESPRRRPGTAFPRPPGSLWSIPAAVPFPAYFNVRLKNSIVRSQARVAAALS